MVRILLISTFSETGGLFAELLEYDGYAVTWIDNAAEGYHQVETMRFDIVLMQLPLRDPPSYDFAYAIVDNDPSLPFILYTAALPSQDAEIMTKLPVKAVIELPITRANLLKTVRQHVRLQEER